jgi:Predicted membrane protein (DUF2079)
MSGLNRMLRRLGGRRADGLALIAIVATTGVSAAVWADEWWWPPDALQYQQRVLEIRGASEAEAQAEVWGGPLSAGFRAGDAQRPLVDQALADPRWIPYTTRLAKRRVLVPLMAAAVYPLAGTDSLTWVAFVGCFAIGPLLYWLLRQRFAPLSSGAACILCLLWPPLRWAFMPLTESWGLALAILALVAAVRWMDGKQRALWLWIGALLALSLTRDLTVVPVIAALALAAFWRERRSAILAGSGILALLPAPLVYGGVSLRDSLAYTLSGNRVPSDTSWSFIGSHYLDAVHSTLKYDFDYLGQSQPRFLVGHATLLLPLAVVFGLALLLLLFARRGTRDPWLTLARGSLLGAAAYMLLNPTFSNFRYELALMPGVAAGLALWISALVESTQKPGWRLLSTRRMW